MVEHEYSVSVVIPSYNCAALLPRAVESVLGQTCAPYEVIVVDDGSVDNTSEIVEQYGDRVRYVYQENAGVAVARNHGIEIARGNWIAFLDADDEWFPHKLERQVSALKAHPELQWCACNAEVHHGNGIQVPELTKRARRQLEKTGYFRDYFAATEQNVMIHTAGMLISKKLLRAVGHFDTNLHGPEDIDLWCRLALKSPQIGYVPTLCYRYYADIPNSLSKNGLKAHYTLMSMQKILRLAQGDYPDKADMYKRYARKRAFRLLVISMLGHERVSREDVRAHLSIFRPSLIEAMTLRILTILPVSVRRKIQRRIRDIHRGWHRMFSRLE